MDAAIGEGSIVREGMINMHVKTLRRKLDQGELIESVWGSGIVFASKSRKWSSCRD